MANIFCEIISKKYKELLEQTNRWQTLKSSELKRNAPKDYLRHGRELNAERKRHIASIQYSLEKGLEHAVVLRGIKLNLNSYNVGLLVAEGYYVTFKQQDNLLINGFHVLSTLITTEDSPIRNLALRGIALDGFVQDFVRLEVLAEALTNPNNKIIRLILQNCYIEEKGAELIANILKNPNCKIEYLDLRRTKLRTGAKKQITAAANSSGREIEILF